MCKQCTDVVGYRCLIVRCITNEITTPGTANTLTLSIPAVFVAPGSIASTTTMAAGTTLTSVGATTLATAGASVNTFGNQTGATSVTIRGGSGGIALNDLHVSHQWKSNTG